MHGLLKHAKARLFSSLLICLLLPAMASCWFDDNEVYTALKQMKVGKHTVDVYLFEGYDVAYLGFAVKTQSAKPRYCAMYVSTYRGIPPVKLTVTAERNGSQLWISSDWPQTEMLAYYSLGSDKCITIYGEQTLADIANPREVNGDDRKPPLAEKNKTQVLATIHYSADK